MNQNSFNGRIAAAIVGLALAGASIQAGVFTFAATLSGAQEVPPNASPGIGSATAVLDSSTGQLAVGGTFSGLSAVPTASHVHTGPAGVAGPILFPLTLSGSNSGAISGSTVGLTTAQMIELSAGRWYVNIHDTMFPGGEIRGQLLLTGVPEPETYAAFAGVGLLGFATWRRFRS